MQVGWVMNCTLVAFFATVTGISASDSHEMVRGHTVSKSEHSVTRSLRTSIVVSNTEERAGLSVPVEKVKAIFSSSKVTPERLQKWLNEGKSANAVFARMHLTDAGEELLFRPLFSQWLTYVDDLSAKTATKKASAIGTLTDHYGDAKLYRAFQAGITTATKKDIATRLQSEQLAHWVATAKDPGDVYHLMRLDKVKTDSILSNQEFATWARYVDDFRAKYPEKHASMIPALLKNFDDITLFRMAETAMSVEGTKSVASNLQDQMVQAWLKSRKSPADALTDLGLSGRLDSLLERPFFSSWLKYANAYSSKYPQEKATAMESLTRQFGDEKVARMLTVAKIKDATLEVATRLESALLQMWFTSGKSVDDVMKLLDLNLKVGFTGNPLLNTWVSFLNVFLKEKPGKATAMLTNLETQFEDRAFHQILLVAMKFPSMEKAAAKIQAEKIKDYFASNRPPAQVFEWLDLGNVGNGLFSDPLFTKWMQYSKDFQKKNPKYTESWFMPIRSHYKSYQKIMEMAMNTPSNAKFAKLLEREQFKYWLETKYAPRYVFNDLKLNDAGENILASPNFKTWAKYLNDFNHRYPKDKMTMIDGLRANYYDIALLPILNAAMKDPSTEKLATNLQGALVNKWIVEQKPLADLKVRFKHLRFADGLLEKYSKKLNAWSGDTS